MAVPAVQTRRSSQWIFWNHTALRQTQARRLRSYLSREKVTVLGGTPALRQSNLHAGLIQNLPGCRLKLVPSRKERIGGVKDVPEQAFPLEGGALDIASAD